MVEAMLEAAIEDERAGKLRSGWDFLALAAGEQVAHE
jgi:hypothetical protein